MLLSEHRKNKSAIRRGTATVELAVIATVLTTLTLGVVEITRLVKVKNILTDTARSGCRLATQPGYTSKQVTDNVNAALVANGIITKNTTITLLVNGKDNDVAKALKGDQISVRVTVPAASVGWSTPLFFTQALVESQTFIMMHQ